MSKWKSSLMKEKYLNDACESVLLNLTRKVKKREELNIWGPTYGQNYFKRGCEEKCDTSSLIDSVVDKNITDKEYYTHSSKVYQISDDVKLRIRTENQNSKTNNQVLQRTVVNRKKRTMSLSESEETENSRKNQAFGTTRNRGMLPDSFIDWCKNRQEKFQGPIYSNNSVSLPTFENKNIIKQKTVLEPKENLCTMSNTCTLRERKKKVNKKSNDENSPTKKVMKHTNKNNDHIQLNTLLSIKLIDDKDEEMYEYMSNLSNILRIKRKYPKLSTIIPEIDSDHYKINYYIDAVNIILRFLINQSYLLEIGPSTFMTGLEVLAATRCWEIHSLHEKFKINFLQRSLTQSNVSEVFSYAKALNLEDICDACRKIAPHNNFNSLSSKRERTCYLTVSIYVEPLEYCIPFTPIARGLELSFDKPIKNTIQFKAISGCYTIVGFQLQLNEDHLMKNVSSNETKNGLINVDYSAMNMSTCQKILNQRVKKYLRPRNIVYFKKGLVVNSNEMGEIVVETDVKPYLCSLMKGQEMELTESARDFKVSVQSSFRFRNSTEKKLFFIQKLFYHVRK